MSAAEAVGEPRWPSATLELARARREILDGVRELSGVKRVFPSSSGMSRWFGAPVTRFVEEGPSVRSWITIGVDRHDPSAGTVGLVAAYVRARLVECGFDFVEVRVRVALLS